MRRNVWTVLTVFVCIFALAWVLNRAKAGTANGVTSSYAATRGVSAPEARQTEGPGAAGAETSSADEVRPKPGAGVPRVVKEQVVRRADRATSDEEQLTPPLADTLPREAPNGMLFAGRGKFQLYRQGDITWRLDTDTGQACVLFATEDQWVQERVYAHGCETR